MKETSLDQSKISKESKKTVGNSKITISESSMYLEEDDESVKIKLSESLDSLLFISKIGCLFSIYVFCAMIPLFFIMFKKREIDEINGIFQLEQFYLFFLFSIILLKIIFIALSKATKKKRGLYFYILDCILLFGLSISSYVYLENYLKAFFIHRGNMLFVFAFTYFCNSVFFTLSTLMLKGKSYKPLLGISLMTFSTIFSLTFLLNFEKHIYLNFERIFVIFALFTLHNVYFCLNSFFILKFRNNQIYENEAFLAFFDFFFDFLFVFWKDLLKCTKIYELKISDLKSDLTKERVKNNLDKKIISLTQV
jgi:hypothetical protein